MEKLIKDILEENNIEYNKIKKSSSGFTNIVYFVDDKYVIKLTDDEETKKQLEKETGVYKNIDLDGIPSFVMCGSKENYNYLMITKEKGVGLYSVWHTLSDDEREDAVKQIAQILKQFNAYSHEFLDSRFVYPNFKKHIKEKLENRIEELANLGEDSSSVKSLIDSDFDGAFDGEIKYGLVYNDAHFDNFLYNKETGKLTLIDFDRVIYAPIDYEMLIFKTMCDNALKFASEEDEDVVFNHEFKNVYGWFKKYYGEMFDGEKTEKRIKIYQFNYLLRQANNWKNPKSKIWRERLLDDIRNLSSETVLTSGV